MNLLEAIKSGYPFRRKIWDEDMWCHVTNGTDGCQEVRFMRPHRGKDNFLPFAHDIMADDWEFREPTVTVTQTQFEEAMDYVLGSFNEYGDPIARCALLSIARKLGLKG